MTKKKKQTNVPVVITAIICVTGLMLYALYLGRNGLLLTGAIGIIAGLAGVVLPTPNILKK